MKLSSYSLAAGHPIVVAIGLVVALAVAWRLLRADVPLSRGRRIVASALAWLALVCAVLAAGEVELVRPADRMAVVVAADRSRSIELVPNAEEALRAQLAAAEVKMSKDDRVGVVLFGGSAALAEPLHAKGEPAIRVDPTISRDATDLEAGIRRAVDEVLAAGGGRVVLVSDGVATRGDALAAAARARALGVPIDVVVLEQQILPDVRVVSARGPSLADEGETIEVRAIVHTPAREKADQKVDVEVTVKRDGVLVQTFRTKVAPGEDVVRFKDKPESPGLHRYDVHVRPLDATIDASSDDNEATAFVRVRGPSTVLVLQKEEHKAAPLRIALEAEGYRVVVRGRHGVPTDLAEFAAFDLVVLADIPAKDLIPSQMDAMAKYVKDFGGGFLLLGSEGSMGPGGYARTPIEEISPVGFDLAKEKRRSALSELIVIDYSGSMAAQVEGKATKLDLANEAASRAAALLGSGDRLGVWHVDTNVRETIKMGPVGDLDATQKKIRSVGPGGGGIYIDLSLKEGYKVLAKESQNLRHMLLFSDGADAEERNDAPNLVKRAAGMGITTSVIALGRGPDEAALEQMAKIGGGRYYLIEDARKLPAVFAQETILAARSSIREEDFVPRVRSSSAALKGLSLAGAPALRGYVVTQVKPRAQLVLDGPEGDPILAVWPLGLGHVAAFTSDFSDRWAGAFSKWPGAAQMMTQLAREIGRKADEARVRLDALAKDGMLHVTAEPTGVAGAGGLLHLRAHVEGPDGQPRDVELLPGPGGTYVSAVPIGAPGAYVVRAIDVGEDGTGTASAGLAAALFSRSDELRPTGSDRRALERIAELTGGTSEALAEVFTRRTGLRPTSLSLAPYLLPLAVALMLLGVAARRLGVPGPLQRAGAAIASAFGSAAARARATRKAPAHETIVVTGAKPTFVQPPERPRAEPAIVAPPIVVGSTRPVQAPQHAAGLAASVAQKRKERRDEKAKAPASPVIVRAERPKAGASAKAPQEGATLADLARKKREKKGDA